MVLNAKLVLSRLVEALLSLASAVLLAKALGVEGAYPPLLSLVLPLLSILGPGFGVTSAAVLCLVQVALYNLAVAVLAAPLLLLIAAFARKHWVMSGISLFSVALALVNRSFDILATSLVVAAATSTRPRSSAPVAAAYALLLALLASTLPGKGPVSAGLIVLGRVQPPTPLSPSTALTDPARLLVEVASLSFNFYIGALMAYGGAGLLQVVTITIGCFIAASASEKGALYRPVGALIASSLICLGFILAFNRAFPYTPPPDFYLPALLMAPPLSTLMYTPHEKRRVKLRKRKGPTFKDVGDLEEAKRELYELIVFPLKHSKLARSYGIKLPRGILLFGPPGCGKTLLMRALANEAGIDFIYVKSTDILSKWYGESERKLHELFQEAKRRAPCILFFDEFEAFGRSRDLYSTDDVGPRLLSILLSEMDGLEEAGGVILVAATNMPELIDPALLRPGRFDKLLYIPPPNKEARMMIFAVHLRNLPTSLDIDLEKLAEITEGYSGADIAAVCQEAARIAAKKSLLSGRKRPITMRDLLEAIERRHPSIRPEDVERYRRFLAGRAAFPAIKARQDAGVEVLERAVRALASRGEPGPILVVGVGHDKEDLLTEVSAKVGLRPRIVPPSEVHRVIPREGELLIIRDVEGDRLLGGLKAILKLGKGFVVACTSSRPWLLDNGFLKLCSGRIFYLPPPDEETRAALIAKELSPRGFSENFDVKLAAKLTLGYSISRLRRLLALLKAGKGPVTMEEFMSAMSEAPPDLQEDELNKLSVWLERFSGGG